MIGIIFSCDGCWPLHDGNKSKAMVVWWCQWLSQCVSRALVAAHMGMAIKAGTDIAIEAADIVLTKSNLEDILQSSHWPSPARGIHIAAGVALPSTGIQLPSWVAGNSYGSLFYDHVLLLSLRLKLQTAECVLPICISNQSHDLPYAQVYSPACLRRPWALSKTARHKWGHIASVVPSHSTRWFDVLSNTLQSLCWE